MRARFGWQKSKSPLTTKVRLTLFWIRTPILRAGLCWGNAMLKTSLAASFVIVLAISPAIGQVRGCQNTSKPMTAAALCSKVSAEKRAITYAEVATCVKATPPACAGSCESGMCRVTYDGNFKQVCTCAH
jgi:hypothetical protein